MGGCIYMTQTTRALQSHDLSGEGINSGSHTFWPHKHAEGLPWWGISLMPGPPPTQHEHERRYTPFILTRRIWKDDNEGLIIFGDLMGLKLPDICLACEEKTRHNLSRPEIETRTAGLQASMLPPASQRWTWSMLCYIILNYVIYNIVLCCITLCHVI